MTVNTPSLQSEIFLGEGCAVQLLKGYAEGQTNFVLTDEKVYALYEDFFTACFSGAEIFVMPSGEEYKNFTTLQAVLEKMSGAGLRRNSYLFAVGGGVVGDLGGLAAALYMRGISLVQVPTTLLAQVDSSVGGKTAINLQGVKNAVGAFYQPKAVVVDFAFLKTLPKKEWKCGVGEVVKYAGLNGELFEKLVENKDKLGSLEFLTSLIEDCIRHKAAVVAADETEKGIRKSLNLGHTTGHAIEAYYGLSHGESVLYGLKAETKIAIQKGVCKKEYGEQYLMLIESALSLESKTNPDFSAMRKAADFAKSDKKNEEKNAIAMAAVKDKNEWTMLTLTEEEYEKAVTEALV